MTNLSPGARVPLLFGADQLADTRCIGVAAFVDGRLVGCLFLARSRNSAPNGILVKAAFESEALGELERRAVLSGKSTRGVTDPGPLICACFGVGLNVIRAALASGAAASVEEIGVPMRAGTNCRCVSAGARKG